MLLDGQNVFIYREANGNDLTVDFCVGVTSPFTAIGAVVPLETPSGLAVTTTHHGDYGGLHLANAAIRRVRDLRRGSVETAEQEEAIAAFARQRKG